eukprot:4339653-Pyramimonas_sp.AAC.1
MQDPCFSNPPARPGRVVPDPPAMGLLTRSARCPPPADFSRAPFFSLPSPPVLSPLVLWLR